MKRSFLSYPLFLWETGVLAAIAFYLCQSNLTGAFHYEFSFFLGIAASFLLTIGSAQRLTKIAHQRALENTDFIRALGASLVSLLAPLFVVLVYSFWIPTCHFVWGWIWFLYHPGVAALFGTSCSVFAARSKRSVTQATFLALLPSLAFLLLNLKDLVFDPPLSFLHPAFGYFSGSLYEESIPIRFSMITFRIWTCGLALWFFIYGTLKTKRQHCRGWRLAGALLLLPLLFRGPLGWHHSAASIEAILGGKTEGKHVVLLHDRTLTPTQAEFQVKILDGRVRSISTALHQAPPHKKIRVYLYPTSEMKRELTGLAFTAIGNPIQQAIHLPPTDLTGLWVAHELTHVLAAPFGIPGLRVSLRVGLLEGLATAVENTRDRLSVHEWARAMKTLHLLPSPSSLTGYLSFWGESPVRAYLASGSFCRWLINQFGIERFKEIYRGGRFENVYGLSDTDLVSAWKRFLDTIPLSAKALSKAKTQLIQRSVFERRCPHDVAEALEKGSECQQSGLVMEAPHHFHQAWVDSGRDPRIGLRWAQASFRAGWYDEIKSRAQDVLKKPELPDSDHAKAWLLLGDLAFLQEMEEIAKSNYESATLKNLPVALKLSFLSRLALMKNQKKELVRDLIKNGPTTSWAVRLVSLAPHPDLGPAYYFAAMHALERGEYDFSNHLLSYSPQLPEFQNLSLELQAQAKAGAGFTKEAAQFYEILANQSETVGERLYYNDLRSTSLGFP